jgi:hypothetical protein
MALKSKGVAMTVLQVAIGIVSLIVGIATLSKESAPYIQRMKEQQYQNEISRLATEQSQMNIQYYYWGNDGVYRYYTDNTGVYWYRINIQGVVEYARHYPNNQINNPNNVEYASQPNNVRYANNPNFVR